MLLGVEPDELPRYLIKKAGERVSKDEIIAAYDALFGLIKRRVKSPIDGTIETVSDVTGQIIARGNEIPVEVDAYIPGRVVEILPNVGSVIETKAAFIQGIFGIGGENHGKIKMAVKSPDEEMAEDRISSADKGSVLVGGSLVTLEALRKSVEVGVSCVVAGGVKYRDITTFMGEEIGIAITGEEDVDLTVIVTEGFGKMKMSQRTFKLLKQFEGYMASVNGTTQIRAGVLRPEIIVPHEEGSDRESGEQLAAGMIAGTPVRIIRQPYFGAIGKVVSLPVELQQVDSQSFVRIVDVELENGKVVSVPRANVEIIEE
jgi:hypothetical protein